MLNRSRFTLTTMTLLTVFALSAMWAAPAFADETTPPPVDPTTIEVPPPVDEPVVVPEGTDVAVVNESGDAIPLASQEAADAIDVADPMWCPTGVTPGSAGCSIDYGSLNALVADVGTGLTPTKSGTIWIEAGPETSAAPIVFDKDTNAAFLTWSAFDLTFQGGWSGLANKTVNILTPSVISQKLFIDWAGSITLKDIIIDGASSVAANDVALTIVTSKNILLDRVIVQNNNNTNSSFVRNGAFLNNSAGTGTVTINNSDFQGNEGGGLIVNSKGVITTNNLTGNLNGGVGAVLDNTFALTDKAVTMKGLKQFSNNGSDGLVVNSDGAITLSNIVSNNNGGGGVVANNTTSLTKQGVTVIGSNSFVGNTGGNGLKVDSQGTITAANLNASDNFGSGAYLDNCYNLGADSDCDVTVAKPVTLTGVNTFKNNGGDGLDILSYGAITVSSLNASNNTGYGAYIDNQWINNAVLPKESVGTWTLNGYGTFNNNGEDGLLGFSHGNMLLNTLTANDNGNDVIVNFEDDGVDLNASKFIGSATVTLRGVNTFNFNFVDGLHIEADGKVTISGILATSNGGDGAELSADDLGMGVTLTGTNTFMYNGDYGIFVYSGGAITASNLTASFNTNFGAQLINLSDPTKPYNVTLTGSNSFNGNGDTGLEVQSFGTILINNLSANENGFRVGSTNGYGAFLTNCIWNIVDEVCDAITPKAVTLTGSANVNGNFQSGMYISSLGAVTATNISADGNGEYGTEIYNYYNNLKPQTVILKGSNFFNDNAFDGLLVYSYGAIALNNVTANNNSGNGAYLDNYQGNGIFAKAITLTGVNSFVGNISDGLYFDTIGTVVLNRFNADWNGAAGIEGLANGGITLVCGHTFFNGAEGYHLESFGGPITIKGIYSAYNVVPTDFTDTVPVLTKACALP